LGAQEVGEVVEAVGSVRVVGAEADLADGQGAFVQVGSVAAHRGTSTPTSPPYALITLDYRGEHGLRGLPDEDWLRQALIAAQARP
jgi:hypothetical protein